MCTSLLCRPVSFQTSSHPEICSLSDLNQILVICISHVGMHKMWLCTNILYEIQGLIDGKAELLCWRHSFAKGTLLPCNELPAF